MGSLSPGWQLNLNLAVALGLAIALQILRMPGSAQSLTSCFQSLAA